MTGFGRRLFRWWTQRRRIADTLAADVSSYLERHWTSLVEEEAQQTGELFDAADLVFAAAPMAEKVLLSCEDSLDDLLQNLDAPFSETLLQMIDAKGMTDAQVYHRAHLSRQHFSKIRSNPGYRPTKATVLALSIAMGLTLDETCLLLERAGLSLSHASKADVIVEYFIEQGERDINVVNRTLYHFDQPVLGN